MNIKIVFLKDKLAQATTVRSLVLLQNDALSLVASEILKCGIFFFLHWYSSGFPETRLTGQAPLWFLHSF